MLIPISDAAIYLECSKSTIFLNKKYKDKIIKKDDECYIEEKDLRYFRAEQDKENNQRYEMTMFMDYLIFKIGKSFYDVFSYEQRVNIIKSIKSMGRLSLAQSELVKEKYWDKYKDQYNQYMKDKEAYIPHKQREPLTKEYVVSNYWNKKKTFIQIGEELNVPKSWVYSEVKRLELLKTKNNIIKKGRKGYTYSKAYGEARQNQPHRRAVVQICPKTFNVVKEYRSICAVSEGGFRRENVRASLKTAGLHGGFLWAEKGLEQAIINTAKKQGNIEKKLKILEFKPPTKEILKLLFIDKDMTLVYIADVFGCDPCTIAKLASSYGLQKRREPIDMEEIKRLRLNERLRVEEIAKRYGRKTSTIAKYLSVNKVTIQQHRRVNDELQKCV